jgi:hypothetical protein
MPMRITDVRDEILAHYANIPIDVLQEELDVITDRIILKSNSYVFDPDDMSVYEFPSGQALGMRDAA